MTEESGATLASLNTGCDMPASVTAERLRALIEAGGELAHHRRARGAAFLGKPSAARALAAAVAARAAARRSRAAARDARSCCATTARVWPSARRAKITHYRYGDVSVLAGGIAAWGKAGFTLFSGTNVPSKAFGEFIEHESGTPSIGAAELHALMESRADMVVLDSRPWDEYRRIAIPGGIDVPGAELVLRARDLAPDPETLVVVNCAGRTRSIIGAQSLIDAGLPNKVVALQQRHDGLDARGLPAGARRGPASAGAVAPARALGEGGGGERRSAPWRRAHRRSALGALARRTRRARPISSTCAIRPNTRPGICRARSRRRAGSSSRRRTSMPARWARASCSPIRWKRAR